MTNQEFKCWVKGYLALSDEKYLDERQIQIINNHAALVAATVGAIDSEIQKFILLIQLEFQKNSKVCFEKIKAYFKEAIT